MASAKTPPAETRRSFVSVLAVITIAAVVVAWQPVQTLISQQAEINRISAAINILNQQRHALEVQSKALDSPAAIAALARQQYQLVKNNQQLVQVLPATRAGVSGIDAADPANDPLVSPTNVMTLDPHRTLGGTTATEGFWGRLQNTLEFWR